MITNLNLRTSASKLMLVLLLSLGSTVSAQVTANWNWAYSLYSANAVTPYPYCQNFTICADAGNKIYTGGTYLGMALSYNSLLTGCVTSFAHPQGNIFEFDTAATFSEEYFNPWSDSDVHTSRVITDKNNDLYIAGTFKGGGVHVATGTLTNTHVYTSDIFIEKITGATGAGVWAISAGGASDDEVADICIDNNQNVYMSGDFDGLSAHFDTVTLTHSLIGPSFVIAKYNSAGRVVWARNSTNSGYTHGGKVCTDNNGYLYVTGTFNDTFTFEGATLISPAGGTDLSTFLAKVDTNGNLVWLKGYYGNSTQSSVACNAMNGVYLTGDFNGSSISLGSFTLVNESTVGDAGIFLARVDSGGNVKWAEGFGGTIGGEVYDVAADGYGNGYITGFTSSAVTPCGSDTIYNLYPYQPVGFAIKFDTLGNVLYAKSANSSNSTGQVIPNSLAVNKRGDVYIAGNLKADTVFFDSKVMVPLMSSLFNSCFIAKIDSVPDCVSAITALSSTTFCAGDSVVLDATHDPGSTYQWYNGSSVISGATNYHYTALSGGVYSVNVTNAYSCLSSANVSVTVNPLAVAGIITGPVAVCTGSTVALTDAATGGSWSSSDASFATVAAGVVTGVGPGVDTIKYAATNSCGTVVAAYTLTVNPTPSLSGTLTPAAICDSTLFSYNPGSVVSGTTFAWTRAIISGISAAGASGSGPVSEVLANTTSVPVNVSYVYTLTASGCTYTETVVVTVEPMPLLSSSLTPAAVCDTTVFSYSPGSLVAGATFAWSRAAVTGISNPPASGTGNPNELLSNTTTAPVSVTYVYTVTANGCDNVESVTVTIEPCRYLLETDNLPSVSKAISIYPDPARSSITITSSSGISSITIFNLLGQQFFTGCYSSTTAELNITQLPAGIYLLRINGADVRRFVKE